jgi:hypothetical protein
MICYQATLPRLLPNKRGGSTLKDNAFLPNRKLSCDRSHFYTLLFFGAVPSLILLDDCERLSAGWTRMEAVQLLRRRMDKQGRAHVSTKPLPTTKHYSTTLHLALQLNSKVNPIYNP